MGAAYRNCRYIAKSLPIVKAKRATMSTNTGAKVKPEKKVAASHITTRHISFGIRGTKVLSLPKFCKSQKLNV